MESAYRWMRESTGLKMKAEALITAAQDQALDTKCHKANTLYTTNDSNAGCAERRMRQ